MWKSVLAISAGASLGTMPRWWLGKRLNNAFPKIPPGTLTANLFGGHIVGLANAFLATCSAIAPEWRLPIVTGVRTVHWIRR